MAIRVGVTGVGGGVGQSIIKALQMSSLDVDIIAIDITEDSAGFYFDGIAGTKVLPNLRGKVFLPYEWGHYILDSIDGDNLDCLIPGSDYDLPALSNLYAESSRRSAYAYPPNVLVSDYKLICDCDDKQYTMKRLRYENLPYPESLIPFNPGWSEWFNGRDLYPCMVKPRHGSGSRGVVKVKTEFDMNYAWDFGRDLICQEYLNGDEYTCSVFVDNHGEIIGTFQLKRELNSGTTYKGEVCFNEEIDRLLIRIGKALKPHGPLNVQLRMTEKGPIPFELNCRCSGTTAIRAHFGFNEPEMLIRHYVLGENLKIPTIKQGKVFRYWNETYKEVA